MKKFTVIFMSLFAISVANSQSATEEIDFFQSIFGMEKKAAVMEFVHPSEETKADFWALYDAYELERKALGKKRIELLNKYAASYNGMSNETADALMKEVLALGKKSNKLLVTYFKKIKKKTSPIVATQFYQMEAYIQSTIRSGILEAIPFVGEMD
jgi:hypothetical protein